MDDELKKYLIEMELRLTKQIGEVSYQIKVLNTEVGLLKHRVTTVERIIRIVDSTISATLSGMRIDMELVKDEIKERK